MGKEESLSAVCVLSNHPMGPLCKLRGTHEEQRRWNRHADLVTAAQHESISFPLQLAAKRKTKAKGSAPHAI